MSSKLPVIVGYGGYNAAGRSSGFQNYCRTVIESLNREDKKGTISSLSALMGLEKPNEEAVLKNTLVRKIEPSFFDVNAATFTRKISIGSEAHAQTFKIKAKDLPEEIPSHWSLKSLQTQNQGRHEYEITLHDKQSFSYESCAVMPVQSAGQLPSGFDPASHYRSTHHPRGLQLAVLGASDAVHSTGIDWQTIVDATQGDEIGVYASSVMSQLESTGLGGMLSARQRGGRVTSKQLAMGLNTMPADFVNAYVLGSVGSTAGIAGACATFLYNLKQGVEDIRSGRRKVVVIGSSEAPILPEIIDGYAAMSALATDANLRSLDGLTQTEEVNHARASRPFGENCGFTLGESTQYAILMSDDLAIELGAQIFGCVPGVYVNADGYKKSISAPGAGNYITMAKAVALAQNLLGQEAVMHHSFIQAHGSSTPQNRVTESKIFDEIAKTFKIEQWPVVAMKSYVGHSLGPASGDQLASSLGIFKYNILPGIKTISDVAHDVFSDRLQLSKKDNLFDKNHFKVSFLNSKGFGGNNATATVFSPEMTEQYLQKKYNRAAWLSFKDKQQASIDNANAYVAQSNKGNIKAIYEFGHNLINEEKIKVTQTAVHLPGFKKPISLKNTEGFDDF